MTVTLHADAITFLKHAEAFLLQQEALNNLMIGIAFARKTASDTPAWFLAVNDSTRIIGAALMTAPPNKLVLTSMPETAAAMLAAEVVAKQLPIQSVLGPQAACDSFIQKFTARTNQIARTGMRQGIYQLTHVIPPVACPGSLSLAENSDLPPARRMVPRIHCGYEA
jgi:hypothetical protein